MQAWRGSGLAPNCRDPADTTSLLVQSSLPCSQLLWTSTEGNTDKFQVRVPVYLKFILWTRNKPKNWGNFCPVRAQNTEHSIVWKSTPGEQKALVWSPLAANLHFPHWISSSYRHKHILWAQNRFEEQKVFYAHITQQNVFFSSKLSHKFQCWPQNMNLVFQLQKGKQKKR